MAIFGYPPARRSDHVDTYKSSKAAAKSVDIQDPYNWLENNSEETDAWVSSQAKFTEQYLSKVSDRDKLREEMKKNMDYAKFSSPSLGKDKRWYWYHNTGLLSHAVIHRSKDDQLPSLSGTDANSPGGEVWFDPNLLSEDGTAALVDSEMSHDGKYWAYSISLSGSDFTTIYVRPTAEPLVQDPNSDKRPTHHDKRLPDEIRFVKFSSIGWTHDSKGFFYQRFPDRESHGLATEDKAGLETTGDTNAMLYYHRVGTPQSEDILVHKSDENPQWMWGAEVSEVDGKYLILYPSRDTSRKNLLWIADLENNTIGPDMKWDKVIDEYDAAYNVIGNDGPLLYLSTNKDAPGYKLITIDLSDPSRTPKELVAEDKEAPLTSARIVNNDKLVIVYKRKVQDEIYIHDLKTGARVERLSADFIGAAMVDGHRSGSHFFATLTGFNTPGTVMVYDDNAKEKWSRYRQAEVAGLNLDDFEAQQVWYKSKDGTKVPMFIVRHKSTPFDGTAPAIQYGYGGFSISINPFFSPSILTVLQKYGVVLAVPNIRGGAEFGEEWHLAGTRERKTNCFDDFIAAAEHLVEGKYAAKGKITINGGSNGGLLVAATLNRAPEGLLGAGIAEVGVLDMLKFADFTIGRHWTSDYGDPHVAEDFDFIYPYSPLHNVSPNKVLPPTLLMTADHDDRVVPLHSFKYAATLQHTLPDNPNPLLIRIDLKAGHGAGKSTEKRIADAADKWGFMVHSLGLKWRD
ncbi:prolyl oligopeptidase [Pterulicium gracile]|uniref:Prolyl endopeptidase n=1 Tax=Pterulicium gracile TaxID=1884261 RepID=A0A5C3QU74_9AGAR|nr:prolyl oligopeptidase [Pterula gracilis]